VGDKRNVGLAFKEIVRTINSPPLLKERHEEIARKSPVRRTQANTQAGE
jgi:hypothetical protein